MKVAPNLILVGPMGSGKSSIGRRLARRLGLAFVDADTELERRTGATIPLIFELEGEAGFRQRERALLASLCAGRDQVIATGGGAVLDPDTRRQLADAGFVIHLKIDIDRQLQRLARDRVRPLLQTADRREKLLALGAQRAPLYAQIADLELDSGRMSVGAAADRLAELLQDRWQSPAAGAA
ncbi:shikimate kinase [Chiayiivirga flava]|uniref:Shikimate kinase n=1 Tax=Chiayiivirga flava TaxID=659595 RepID=A0A7W8D5U8_9GAMM|nr:shikimate kinase [Chiayiivirga flava]MBB5207271.1 shikimate kinase [Chiayiivirga flava]